MARIYCTRKLQDFIGEVKEELPENLNGISMNDWNAHLFFIDKKKCLIFMNNLTFYTLFVTGILKKDLKDIDTIFYTRLREQLISDRIINGSELPESVFSELKPTFYKTINNKKVIGRVNDFVSVFKIHCSYKYGSLKDMNVVFENRIINETPTGKLLEVKKSWSRPRQNVIEMMKTGTFGF
jgi:hypothetical protein